MAWSVCVCVCYLVALPGFLFFPLPSMLTSGSFFSALSVSSQQWELVETAEFFLVGVNKWRPELSTSIC